MMKTSNSEKDIEVSRTILDERFITAQQSSELTQQVISMSEVSSMERSFMDRMKEKTETIMITRVFLKVLI